MMSLLLMKISLDYLDVIEFSKFIDRKIRNLIFDQILIVKQKKKYYSGNISLIIVLILYKSFDKYQIS